MHYRRRTSDPRHRAARTWSVFLFCVCFIVFLFGVSVYLRRISTQIAISDARDIITSRINSAVAEIMREGAYEGDYFISFEKGSGGEVTAISCNMARINALSAVILDRVVGATENYTATVQIPLGNLTGLNLLMGRGPMVPVEIVTLTSSRVEFRNGIVTAGINQTKHQITLELHVDIDILVPWGSESTQVVTEVLIADTVIVGRVPDTYLDLQGTENK